MSALRNYSNKFNRDLLTERKKERSYDKQEEIKMSKESKQFIKEAIGCTFSVVGIAALLYGVYLLLYLVCGGY